MRLDDFERNLFQLASNSVQVFAGNSHVDGCDLVIKFSEGSQLQCSYWRLIKNGVHRLSSFDDKQQYGLPSPINAIEELKTELRDKVVSQVLFDKETGDIIFNFSSDLKLQALNFTGYEVWTITFSDRTGEYSNYAREYALKA